MKWYRANGKKAAWGGTHHAVANQLLQEGFSTEGLALMEIDLKETPTKIWLLRKTAQAFLENGNAKKALEFASKGIEQKPEDPGLLEIQSEAERELSKGQPR